MEFPRTIYVGEHPATAWRRFVYAACFDCLLRVALRDYRSMRARNRKAITAAAARHRAENPSHLVEVGYGHG